MSQDCEQQERLTTAEVAALTGRSESAVRNAISKKHLPAARIDGRRYISRNDALAWDKSYHRLIRTSSEPWERAAQLLTAYHSLSAEELAEFAGIHVGNARKHLEQLRRRDRAERRPDGQWVLTAELRQGAA
ncbi:MAG: helix-turn-helix domain-containing protein [Actinomycetota bacterium]|nr:helix-turn-helix domain-containing protein [Actinomycetota bacterium]